MAAQAKKPPKGPTREQRTRRRYQVIFIILSIIIILSWIAALLVNI